jgi:hypothetical protein
MRVLLTAGALALLTAGCDPTEPDPVRLFSRTTVTLTPEGGGPVVTLTAVDPDANGLEVTFTASGPLAAGATYDGRARFYDDASGEEITGRIEGDPEGYLAHYHAHPHGAAEVTVTDAESDYGPNGGADLPVGLAFEVAVSASPSSSGLGVLHIVLYHFAVGAKTSEESESEEAVVDLDFPISFG